MIRAQLVGATGYGGVGMVELLLRHPEIRLTSLLAVSDIGKPLSAFYPHLRGYCDQVVEEAKPERVGQDATRRLAETTFRHLHDLSLRFHLERRTGAVTKIVERGTKSIDMMLYFILFNIGPTFLQPAICPAE